MSSPFEQDLPDAFAAINEVLAKPYSLTPMKEAADVNAPWIADDARTARTVNGIYYDKEAKPVIMNAFDPRTDLRPGTVSGTPRLEFLPEPATGLAPDIRRGDLLTAASGTTWRVQAPFVKKSGIRVCPLNVV